MNETVNLSGLIVRLGAVTGADSNTCRRYIKILFDTLGQALSQLPEGGAIEVPGLGTFVRTLNPTTSEPDVTFRPDRALDEEANRPFAAFEAEVLAEGVTPEDFRWDEDADNQEPAAQESQTAAEQEPAPEPEAVPEAPEAPEIPEAPEAPEQAPVADIVAQEEVAQKSPEAESTPNVDIDENVQPSFPEDENVQPSFPEDEDQEEASDYSLPEPPRRKKSSWGWVIAIAIVIGLGVGLFLGLTVDVGLPENEVVETEEEILLQEQTPDGVPESEDPAAEAEDDATATAQAGAPAASAPASPAAPAQSSEDVVYETVSATNYLSSMARRHYGAQIYWVYIYEANADILGHPDRIAPGTRIKIPPRSSFPPAANESEARRMAERKAAEINRRYR